jgi:hypothetical protein
MYHIRKQEGRLSAQELPVFAFVPLIGKEGWVG